MNDAKKAVKYIFDIKFPPTIIILLADFMLAMLLSIFFKNFIFMLVFAIPSILSSFTPILKLKYFASINFVSSVIEYGIFSIGLIFNIELVALVVAFSVSYAFRVLIFLVMGLSGAKSIMTSSIRLFTAFILFSFSDIGYNSTLFAQRILSISLIFTIIIFLFVNLVSKPFKKVVGINPFTMFFSFATDWLNGTNTIESHLANISEKNVVVINIIKFERKKESIEKSLKAVFLVPYIHPGPFGNIGSSAMSEIFSSWIEKSITFHGSCTHDLNLVKSDELRGLIKKINENTFFEEESDKCRFISDDEIAVIGIGNKKIAVCDGDGDIDLGVGLASSDIFIDMHSSGVDDIITDANCMKGFKIIEKSRELSEKLGSVKEENLKVGISSGKISVEYAEIDVKVAVMEANEKYIFIVFDSNNLKNRKILGKIQTNGKIFPITTDSHYMAEKTPRLHYYHLKEIERLIKEAEDNMEEVKAKVGKIKEELEVMGNGSEMLSSVNISIAILKVVLPVMAFIMSFLVIIAIFYWR